MKPPEFSEDILDALAMLTNRTPGDIFYKISEGGFKELAIEALQSFSKNYNLLDRKEDSDPFDDSVILQSLLCDLEDQLKITTDPVELADLKADIISIKQRMETS